MTKLNEKEIIDLFFSNLLRKNKTQFQIKDDVSLLSYKDLRKNKVRSFNSYHIVIKSDMLVESTDVVKKMKIWQIARKSIVSAVSDMSAKGIKAPYFSLLSIGIPRSWTKYKIKNLIVGFEKASKEFGVVFLGGDTNESKELVIDCILVGFLDSTTNNIPLRNNAKAGDIVITSGKFGYTSSGLKILLFNSKAISSFKKQAISSILLPKPSQKFGTLLGEYFSSSIDSSDGLGISLYELASQSKVNFYIDDIPIPIGLIEFAKTNSLNIYDLIFNGGEEYEIVATVNPSNFQKVKFLCQKFHLPMFVIGKVMTGNSNVFVKYKNKFGLLYDETMKENNHYFLLKSKGFLHFT
ncbi:MAG TPA: thiamine-phosphate kinase [Nitrososphaeraceae archaeon]|nr:thiamine-phosphate kinase [Nitrososphaeraceae archaeon]